MPRSNSPPRTVRCRSARSVAPQPSLMLLPLGSSPIATTSAPSDRNACGAIPEYAPLAQSTAIRRPERSAPKRSSTCSRYESTAISTRSTDPGCAAGGASRSASICSSAASVSFSPSASKNFTPLYSGGLCEAEMTTPRSRRSSATAGVGSTPPRTAFPPAETTPRAKAASSAGPEPRVSRPTKTRPRPDQRVAARPSRSTSSSVRNSPTMPRTPSVPKYLRAMRARLTLGELRAPCGPCGGRPSCARRSARRA